MKTTFDILLLLARPAAGKSEIIDHLKQTPLLERIDHYHIGDFDVIDDFPMLWTWYEEDDILSRMGHPRLYTDVNGLFKWKYLWDLLIERICLDYEKKVNDAPDYHIHKTTIIEFARGTEHGGFSRAFDHLNKSIIKKSAILYIDVSWYESLRKNQTRFNPDRPHSILEHGLTDEKLYLLYHDVDWEAFTKENDKFIHLQGESIPYTVFHNEDDVTTKRGDALTSRLANSLEKLWSFYMDKTSSLCT